MADESIFHKLFTIENSYTQLLCNLLKRDGSFRGDFFAKCCQHLRNRGDSSDIWPQKRLSNCGQADVLVCAPKTSASPGLCMVIEVKTEPHRPLEPRQRLLDEPDSYQWWLEKQKAAGSEAWLVFLVPASWEFRDELREEMEAYKRRHLDMGIFAHLMLWEEILDLLPKDKPQDGTSLAHEFRLFLEERFGPIGFDREETNFMFNENFPLQTVLKLNALIDKMGKEAGLPCSKLDITKDEFGLYFRKEGQGKQCWLYFGCWLSYWEHSHNPLCFGLDVEKASPAVIDAFRKALKQAYQQDAFLFDESWLMGWVPEEDLNKANAFEEIRPKLQRIWNSMTDAADREILGAP